MVRVLLGERHDIVGRADAHILVWGLGFRV